jgi:ankyrin repeat protein
VNDAAQVRELVASRPELATEILSHQGELLLEFAGIGNTEALRILLDLGADVRTVCPRGDGYWGIAANSLPLHVAAWRARHDTVQLLLDRGSPVNALDGQSRTPLALAVLACVDSYWTDRRSPESVRVLLEAGARLDGISLPTGYAEIDVLLEGLR